MMHYPHLRLLGAALAVALVLPAAWSTPPATVPPDEWIEKGLRWLPQGTETVMVARGPFTLSKSDLRGDGATGTLSNLLRAWSLWELPWNDDSPSPIAGVPLIASVEGSRNYRRSVDLGLMPYDGAHIVVFAEDVRDRVLSGLTATGRSQKHIGGQEVTVFTVKRESDTWRYFVTFPEKQVLLFTTDEESMRSVLSRMAIPKEAALPASLSEWRYVDRKAPFWGLRHYVHGHVDPSQPFTKGNVVFGRKGETDPSAVGLTFTFDPRTSTSAWIRYLSTNPKAERVAERLKSSREPRMPAIRTDRLGPKAVQITVLDAEHHEEVSLYLLWFLGKGICI